jgi:hypothetical protein
MQLLDWRWLEMSREAIAAVLARADLASGQRLVALSLASFADRENRAWPGAPAASARAGLSRSRYQQAREQLVARGLVVVDARATGRGRASTLTLAFADSGPWWDGEINVELFESVLAYSRARGPERLLLATMAALADGEGLVRDVATEQLCGAAGVADRTYRRARSGLLAAGELELVSSMGGRGNTNVWSVPDPRRSGDALHAPARRRMAPPVGARPLMVDASSERAAGSVQASTPDGSKAGQDRTVSARKCPTLTGVTDAKGGHDRTVSPGKCPDLTGVSASKGGQDRTLFDLAPPETPAQTPAKTPAETPAPDARAGREPQNPRTEEHPPNPPAGGSSPDAILVEEAYVTARGRKRHRHVQVDLDAVRRGLGLPVLADRDSWERIRAGLRDAVGDSIFEIWLEPLELIAVDPAGPLVISAPAATCSWLRSRYAGVLRRCAEREGREMRIAHEPERRAFAVGDEGGLPAVSPVHINDQEVS